MMALNFRKVFRNCSLLLLAVCGMSIVFSKSVSAQEFSRIESTSGFNLKESTRGIAVADYDGDNDLDVFIVVQQSFDGSEERTWSKLYRNNNNATFTDVTQSANLNNGISSFYLKRGASWGDFNNDGFPDLMLTYQSGIQLYQNLGNGKFQDVSTTSKIMVSTDCEIKSSMWFDYNNDGLLDIFISGFLGCSSNRLYKNLGNGTFDNLTVQLELDRVKQSLSYMAIPVDVNHDGFTDVYSAVDFGENQLFVNNAGNSFSEKAADYKLNSPNNDMALTTGDYNNDGIIDIFCTDINVNSLFKGNKNHTFTDQAALNGVKNAEWAWEARFADYDNDGDEDIFVVNGYEDRIFQNFLFRNLWIEKGGGFSDVSKSSQVGIYYHSECFESFDYDNDGDLDLLVSSEQDGKSPVFYNNTLIDQTIIPEKRWFKVSLEGTKSNRNGFGASLEIRYGGKKQFRLYHGVGLYSQSAQPVHFGVGNVTQIDTLLVKWPSGEIDTLKAMPTNIHVEVKERTGSKIIKLSNNKVYGCVDINSCSFNSLATISDGESCTYLAGGKLTGPSSSRMFKTETYTYEGDPANKLVWNVESGEIIDGNGTSAIQVRWGISGHGKVSVYEKGICFGDEVSVPVKISLDLELGEHSVARIWNEALLVAIRDDYARPTIHARNLFHISVAMYDAWAVYDKIARPYLLGNRIGNFENSFSGYQTNGELVSARNKTISFAAYRLLKQRFSYSPNFKETKQKFDEIMILLGYDTSITSKDYSKGDPASLGNYIAQTVIDFGLQDGSRESSGYDNAFYIPVNPPLEPVKFGNSTILDPNRWQPLSLKTFIDQSGHVIEGSVPKILSPEWGSVVPFSLRKEDSKVLGRYTIYEDPGAPPYLNDPDNGSGYKWCFSMVSIWGSHLSPDDGVMWDISPGTIGNVSSQSFPLKVSDYSEFYQLQQGGDLGKGHKVNPVTGQSYEVQMVPRGDYTRVLAEFWADGPHSETPPGHWFTILNYVGDHQLFQKKFEGNGQILEI